MVAKLQIKGLAEIEKKLSYAFLVDPAAKEAVETIGKRLERQGKGLGAQRNTITREPTSAGARLFSTLHAPRTTGVAWVRKNAAVFKAVAPNALRKAARRIEARWAE
jgi:hypothetical protein